MNTNRIDSALEYFNGGLNCAQSVVMAYCDLFGMTPEQGKAVASGYGGGIAGTRAMCGTVNAMIIIAGLKSGGGENKPPLNHTIVSMINEFRETAGTDNCKELLISAAELNFPALSNYDIHKFKRPCAKFVVLACEIIQRHLGLK